MKMLLNLPEESDHTQTPGRRTWCCGGVDKADLFYCTQRQRLHRRAWADEDAVYVFMMQKMSFLLYGTFLPVDVGTFTMNPRTTLSDLAPKTMKSGPPGYEPGVIHLFQERTAVTMIVRNRVAKK